MSGCVHNVSRACLHGWSVRLAARHLPKKEQVAVVICDACSARPDLCLQPVLACAPRFCSMERGDAPWREEDRCEARYGAQGVEKHRRWQTKWYPGTIISVSDDACDVKYDDGDVEMSVPLMFIRAAKSPSAPAAAASAGAPSKSTDATTPPPVPDLFEYVCSHCERSFPSKRGMLIHASRCKSKAARREPPRRETVVVALDDSDDDEDDSSRPGGGGAEKQERSPSVEAEGEEESEESAADSDDDYAGGAAAAARPAGRGRAKPKAPPRKRRKDDDDDDDDEEEEE